MHIKACLKKLFLDRISSSKTCHKTQTQHIQKGITIILLFFSREGFSLKHNTLIPKQAAVKEYIQYELN